MDTEQAEHLVQAAVAARERAYAPYSRFRVGAAVLAAGALYSGCNVENASYGLTICAERVAVFTAVAAGQRHIDAIAVATDGARAVAPCGACRQVLHEFGPEMIVVLAGATVRRFSLADLLPDAFSPADLPG
jgi:cytidine deaminase